MSEVIYSLDGSVLFDPEVHTYDPTKPIPKELTEVEHDPRLHELPYDAGKAGRGTVRNVQRKWNRLKKSQETAAVDHLRLRADLVDAIHDCYANGITRRQIAQAIGVTESRVTALVQGNYRPGPGSRTLASAPTWTQDALGRWLRHQTPLSLLEALRNAPSGSLTDLIDVAAKEEAEQLAPEQEIHGCRYCGDKAEYKVDMGNERFFFTCRRHAPT